MTRIITIALALIFVALPAFALEEYGGRVETETETIFTSQYLAANGTANSTDVFLGNNARGAASLFVRTTGSGTLKFEVRVSDDGTNWYTPSGSILGSSISDDIATTTAAGNHCFVFDLPVTKWLRIPATEDGTSANATITSGVLVWQ